jgi:integrase
MEELTFGEWLEIWLQVYKEPNLTEESVYRMRSAINNHVSETVLETPLSELKTLILDKELSECKFSRTRKYLYFIFCNSLKTAWRKELIQEDISSKLEPVRYRKNTGNALTVGEQELFLKNISDSKYRNVFEFMLNTGCRRSETLNLIWDDINWREKVIYVRGTKTETSNRIIFLTNSVARILKRQAKETGNNEKVFPYNKTNVTHAFKRYCPRHHLHELRHTFVTRCAESGIDVKVTQMLAGHSDVHTTLQIYAHAVTDFQRKEFKKFRLF